MSVANHYVDLIPGQLVHETDVGGYVYWKYVRKIRLNAFLSLHL